MLPQNIFATLHQIITGLNWSGKKTCCEINKGKDTKEKIFCPFNMIWPYPNDVMQKSCNVLFLLFSKLLTPSFGFRWRLLPRIEQPWHETHGDWNSASACNKYYFCCPTDVVSLVIVKYRFLRLWWHYSIHYWWISVFYKGLAIVYFSIAIVIW